MMDISPSFTNNTSNPMHVLIQLSTWQWKRFSANSIHLTGRTISNKHVYYSGSEYGSNIKFNLRREKVYDEKLKRNQIDLNRSKQSIVYVTTTYDEIADEVISGRVHVVDGTARCHWNNQDDNK